MFVFRQNTHLARFSRALLVLTVFVSVISMFLPLLVSAQEPGIVPCDGPRARDENGEPCGYNTLLVGVQNLLNYFIYLAGAVAVVMFVWAGFLLITSGGSSSKKDQAKNIFYYTFVGFLFTAGAWLIVATILGFFVDDGVSPSLPIKDVETTQERP